MSEKLISPYEISIWDDTFTYIYQFLDKPGEEEIYHEASTLPDASKVGAYRIVDTYYKEELVAIIGSDKMTTPIRAHSPKLVSNINGSHTFTFALYLKYFDYDTGKYLDNPYIPYLVNERKIKLKYRNKWYDLLIKKIDESSDKYSSTFECSDLYINELSKNGFALEFDTELKNNSGTVDELGSAILKETDWRIDEDATEIIQQRLEDALYEITLNTDITPIVQQTDKPGTIIPKGTIIYAYSDSVRNQTEKFQFIYEPTYDGVIVNGIIQSNSEDVHDYYITGVTYNNGLPSIAANTVLRPAPYKGLRLVETTDSFYDPVSGKTVNVYRNATGDTLYGYTSTEYISPTLISNLITNAEAFIPNGDSAQVAGWEAAYPDSARIDIFPPSTQPAIVTTNELGIKTVSRASSLLLNNTSQTSIIRNSGLNDNPPQDGIIKGNYYVLHILAKTSQQSSEYIPYSAIEAQIAKYTVTKNTVGETVSFKYRTERIDGKVKDITYLEKVAAPVGATWPNNFPAPPVGQGTWKLYRATRTATWSELRSLNISLFFSHANNEYIEKIEFFPYLEATETMEKNSEGIYQVVKHDNPVIVTPENQAVAAQIVDKTQFYIPGKVDDKDNVILECELPLGQIPEGYSLSKRENFEKVRSITDKESNRFNLIQTLCETFECWAKFNINHNDDGSIKRVKEVDESGEVKFRYDKRVSFHNYIGKDNEAGFKYGINLKNVSRKLESDQLVSRLVVKQNANEFAQNGFCSIARAPSSPTKESFLYNFNYYVQKGLLDGNTLNNDLYLTGADNLKWLGYYPKLKQINDENQPLITEQGKITSETQRELESKVKTYDLAREKALKSYNDRLAQLETYTTWDNFVTISQKGNDLSYDGFFPISQDEFNSKQTYYIKHEEQYLKYNGSSWDNEQQLYKRVLYNGLSEKSLMDAMGQKFTEALWYLNAAENYEAKYNDANTELSAINARLDYINDKLNENRLKKDELNKKFYEKYSRFIQEGSWIDENYIEDELYYLDAEGVLATSTSPKVSYTINVIDVSPLNGYQGYSYEIGDKTYMEDTEFFGYTYINGVKTPYQEEIVLSESTEYLEEPEKNSFKVQNFKTQFEDLFQRIAATTQSLSFSAGSYNRVANIINSNGTLTQWALQDALAANDLTLQNTADQSVKWDDSGITISSLVSPNQLVRLTSGGIYLSTDGGATWTSGITGTGVNAGTLTSGLINTDRIRIMNGSFPSFKWDGDGISAYWFDDEGNFDFNKFVRLDKYGLYSHIGDEYFKPENVELDGTETPEEKQQKIIQYLQDNTQYSLTWDGFSLKTKNGAVKIDSDYGIRVTDNGINRLQIGEVDEDVYGIVIKDNDNNEVLKTEANGQLWLKDKLHIGNAAANEILIGNLDNHEVINANNNFIVYDDGSIVANNGTFKGELQGATGTFSGELVAASGKFSGEIVATSGKIGNLTIAQVEEAVSGGAFEIIQPQGNIFKVAISGAATPNYLTFEAKSATLTDETIYSWQYANTSTGYLEFANTKQISFYYNDFKTYSKNDVVFIKCIATTGDSVLEKSFSVTAVSDGKATDIDLSGLTVTTYEIETNYEQVPRYYINGSVALPPTFTIKLIDPKKQIQGQAKQYETYYENSNFNYDIQLTLGQVGSTNTFSFTNNEITDLNFAEPNSLGITYNLEIVQNRLNSIDPRIEIIRNTLYSPSSDCYAQISIYKNDILIAEKVVLISNQISESLLKFAINADNVTAAIDEAGLEFSREGLVINNGNFIIKDNAENVKLSFDYNTGNLIINGSGSFSGEVNAESGHFNNIHLDSASIGNDEQAIKISATEGISANFVEGATGFLISPEGRIVANDITLSHFAKISDYLQLGDNCFIRNPNSAEGAFIEVRNSDTDKMIFGVDSTGTMKVGELLFDGENSEINSGGLHPIWSINKNGATFNNIIAKGSIQASVLEAGKVQAIGGMVLVRPSSMIKEVIRDLDENNNVIKTHLYLETNDIWSEQEGFCLIGQDRYINKYYPFTYISPNELVIDTDETISEGDVAVLFSRTSSFAVGINSTNHSSAMPPEAISLFNLNFGDKSTTPIRETNTIIGRIPIENYPQLLDENDASTYGYGLYSDNAIINGAIVSITDTFSSGINAKSKALDEKTNNPVIFWAGAGTTTSELHPEGIFSKEAVRAAPFRVDSEGNLYANRGTFEGSILTNATLTASTISTSKIIGNGKDDIPALSIYNANKAISFYDREDIITIGENGQKLVDEKTELMSLSLDGLDLSNIPLTLNGLKATVDLNNSGYATKLSATGLKINDFSITNNQIIFNSEQASKSINFNGDTLAIQNIDGKVNASFNNNEVQLGGNLQFEKNLRYGSSQMEERQVLENGQVIGYDLYIL